MGIARAVSWWKWLLKFNPVKYLGLLVMAGGQLFFIYLYIFRDLSFIHLSVGCALSLIIGFIIWLNGWDPYEDIIEENQAIAFLMEMKEFFALVAWYKWVLSYNPMKYIALSIMTAGPMYFIHRIIFLGADPAKMMVFSCAVFIIGTFFWIISWDPYS